MSYDDLESYRRATKVLEGGIISVRDVEDVLVAIEDTAYDPEVAHDLEDHLYFGVLWAIASGTIVDAPACAAKATEAKDIDFPRWCA
jgi:hypothetical protein